MTSAAPNIIVIAGPNGAGKSTAAPALLRDYLGVVEFVNADVIAQGLSGFGSESMGIQAGRIMLARLRALAQQKVDFAFETTLASKSFAPWLNELRQAGYRPHLVFLWLRSPEMAVARVASRVIRGGHHVDDETVRRRYHAGLRNFFQLYRPLMESWALLDNSNRKGYQPIAEQAKPATINIFNAAIWKSIEEHYS